MSAQPYAWPALQTNIAAIMSAIKEQLASTEVQLGRVMPVSER
jgi:hypothetical protein